MIKHLQALPSCSGTRIGHRRADSKESRIDNLIDGGWCTNTPEKNVKEYRHKSALCPLPADSTSQLNVLRHDSHALSMDGTQVGVLEQPDQIRLRCFLQCQNRGTLEPQIRLEVLSNFPYQPLERQLTDQKLRRLLVLANLTESNSPRPVPVGLLHSPCCRRRLSRRLRRQLLPRRLASGRLPRSLLSTSHQRKKENKN